MPVYLSTFPTFSRRVELAFFKNGGRKGNWMTGIVFLGSPFLAAFKPRVEPGMEEPDVCFHMIYPSIKYSD
jgi:hypothetical protein